MAKEAEFKVWWDEKEGVMRILSTGDQTEEIARKMVAEERRLITELNKRGINIINTFPFGARIELVDSTISSRQMDASLIAMFLSLFGDGLPAAIV